MCTSSLDLGVDFSPVERVLQIGSPKGVARLLQRAGRSGHSPGQASRVTIVPTHAFELVEAAAARHAIEHGRIESRTSPVAPVDVLVQHLVTIAMGSGETGFEAAELYEEVRTAYAYRELRKDAFDWALGFVLNGGTLNAYPEFQRVSQNEAGRYCVVRKDIARRHMMSIGTIVSDASMKVAWQTGGSLGTVEESFIARLKQGDCFTFGGRVLELVRVRDMTAYVRKAPRNKGTVPQWQGGKMPLSSELANASLELLARMQAGEARSLEMQAVEPLMAIQQRLSTLPTPEHLLVESLTSKEGCHLFLYPFAGRTVNLGIGSLLAYRAAKENPGTFSMAVNDYGIELLSAEPVDWQTLWRDGDLLQEQSLFEDIVACLNSSELAQRRFREIARVAGLVFQGFPGAGKSTKQLQASSGLFFQVFKEHDPDNLLLHQASREALEQELELDRLRAVLSSLRQKKLSFMTPSQATPFAFPLMVERLRERISTEKLSARVARLLKELDKSLQ